MTEHQAPSILETARLINKTIALWSGHTCEEYRRPELRALDRAKDAAEELIASQPATSIAEAVAQILIAASRIGTICDPGPFVNAEEETEKVEYMLFSAIAAIAEEAGINIKELGGRYYLPYELGKRLGCVAEVTS